MTTHMTLAQGLRSLLCATVLLCAACSPVNAENYDRIKTGMTPDEVHEILGKPDTVDAGSLADFEMRTEIWESRKLRIELSFLNGKLMRKSIGERQADR